jgi:hypothetical protein
VKVALLGVAPAPPPLFFFFFFVVLLKMSEHLSGNPDGPSPEEPDAESPGREALLAEGSTAPDTHDGAQDHDSDSDSVADSAIETDILSTMTTTDECFQFIEENGRTYHSYKAPSKLTSSHITLHIPS